MRSDPDPAKRAPRRSSHSAGGARSTRSAGSAASAGSDPPAPNRVRLTFGQPVLPRLRIGSMRPWESLRPPENRRCGVPRSHGPDEERVDRGPVSIRLTSGSAPSWFSDPGPAKGASPRQSADCAEGVRSTRSTRSTRSAGSAASAGSGPPAPTRVRLTFGQPVLPRLRIGSMRPWESLRPPENRRCGVPRSHGPDEERVDRGPVNLRLKRAAARNPSPAAMRWPAGLPARAIPVMTRRHNWPRRRGVGRARRSARAGRSGDDASAQLAPAGRRAGRGVGRCGAGPVSRRRGRAIPVMTRRHSWRPLAGGPGAGSADAGQAR